MEWCPSQSAASSAEEQFKYCLNHFSLFGPHVGMEGTAHSGIDLNVDTIPGRTTLTIRTHTPDKLKQVNELRSINIAPLQTIHVIMIGPLCICLANFLEATYPGKETPAL